MKTISRLLQLLVAQPVLTYPADKQGRPIAKFNLMQCRAYPELCKEQALEALSHCDEKSRRYQLAMLRLVLPGLPAQ